MPRPSHPKAKTDELAALGAAVKELRSERHLTQEGLAELAEMDTARIGEAERGVFDLRFTTIVRIARGLDVDLSELMARAERLLKKAS